MCLRLSLLVILLFSGLAIANRPAVVVLAPFKYSGFSSWRDRDRWQLITPFREQVAGELARSYQCVVLSRSFGYALSMEDAVKRLGAIEDSDFAPEELAGADYSFTGIFDPDRKTIALRMVDLRSVSAQWEDKVTSLNVPVFEVSAAQVAQGIAEMASIPKRESPRVVDSGRRTWMVLPPVVTANALKDKQDEMVTALQMTAEIVLQKGERVKLVDHSALETVLKEHAMGGVRNEVHLRKVSRLVGAERALIALVSNTGRNDEVRMDVLVLDVARTEIVSAVTRYCGKDGVLKAVEECTAECAEGLGVPSQLSPATPAQRLKEARLYLDTAKKNFETSVSSIASLVVMEYAEMIYLLARDSQEMMYDITKFVASGNRSWAGYLQKRQRVLVKGEPSQFIRRVLEQCPRLNEKDNGLWAYYVAQSFSADKDYASARQVAEKALKSKLEEDVQPDLRRVLAECYYAEGDYQRALACTKGDKGEGYTRVARVKISQALGEDAEFAAMSEISSKDYFWYGYYFENPGEVAGDSNLWFRHIELLDKRKGPAAVCAFIEKDMDGYAASYRDHIKYELAKYYAKAGDKKKAAEICHPLLAQGTWIGWKLKNADFRKLLEELIAEVGDAAEPLAWLKACEVREIPKGFAFYIQPVGEVRSQLIEAVRSGLESFFGAKAAVLPAFELSLDAPYYVKESNRYSARLLTEAVKLKMVLPSNALSAVMIMEDELFGAEANIPCWSWNDKWFTIITSAKTWAGNAKDQETALRNLAIQRISVASWLVGYGDMPCITSPMQNSLEVQNAKFAYSPKAQELYKKVDFAAKNRAMIDLFRESGATIVEPPRE